MSWYRKQNQRTLFEMWGMTQPKPKLKQIHSEEKNQEPQEQQPQPKQAQQQTLTQLLNQPSKKKQNIHPQRKISYYYYHSFRNITIMPNPPGVREILSNRHENGFIYPED